MILIKIRIINNHYNTVGLPDFFNNLSYKQRFEAGGRSVRTASVGPHCLRKLTHGGGQMRPRSSHA
jgi:hypothetical protein